MSELEDSYKREQNLYNWWLNSVSQKPPEGFEDFASQRENLPKSVWMKPEDMWRYINAQSAAELLLGKGDPLPSYPLNYPTVAQNWVPEPKGFAPRFHSGLAEENLGKQPMNMYASELGSPFSTLGKTMNDVANDYMAYTKMPQNVTQFVPQGVQAHEIGHTKSIPRGMNRGYINIGKKKLSGDYMLDEIPAIISEEKYWVNKRGKSPERLNMLREKWGHLFPEL